MTTGKAILPTAVSGGHAGPDPQAPGVISTRVGYTGGDAPNATYRNHRGHTEAIEVVFDTDQLSYLWMPKTSSAPCDQAIIVDQATDASLSSDAVLLKIDWIKISAVCHASSRWVSRSHVGTRVMKRKANCRHMTGDHHGRGVGRATLLVRAVDGILGAHGLSLRKPARPDAPSRSEPRPPRVRHVSGWPATAGPHRLPRRSPGTPDHRAVPSGIR